MVILILFYYGVFEISESAKEVPGTISVDFYGRYSAILTRSLLFVIVGINDFSYFYLFGANFNIEQSDNQKKNPPMLLIFSLPSCITCLHYHLLPLLFLH